MKQELKDEIKLLLKQFIENYNQGVKDYFNGEVDKIVDKFYPSDEPTYECCICGNSFRGHGNNASPLKTGQCCNNCNTQVIIYRMLMGGNE